MYGSPDDLVISRSGWLSNQYDTYKTCQVLIHFFSIPSLIHFICNVVIVHTADDKQSKLNFAKITTKKTVAAARLDSDSNSGNQSTCGPLTTAISLLPPVLTYYRHCLATTATDFSTSGLTTNTNLLRSLCPCHISYITSLTPLSL